MATAPDPYALDDDNPELTVERIDAMRPASAVLPPELYASLVAGNAARSVGTRLSAVIDLDSEVVDKLRSDLGEDWARQAGLLLRKAVGL